MMKTILIGKQYHPKISTMLNVTDKKYRATPLVTFIIDRKKNKLSLIGGRNGELSVITVPLEEQAPQLKDSKWSMDAQMFNDYCQNCLDNASDDEPIVFFVDEQPNMETYIIGVTSNYSVRRWQCEEPCQEHLDHFTALEHRHFLSSSTDILKTILNQANYQRPFDSLKMNKGQNEIMVQRDNAILRFALPNNLAADIDLVVDRAGLEILENVCQHAQSDSIMVSISNEQMTVSDGQHHYSAPRQSLPNFEKKSKNNAEIEATLIVNILTLKSETYTYKSVHQIKHNNTSLILITENEAYLSALGSTVESFQRLSTLNITASEPNLYSINLSQLLKVKIKDITAMNSVTMRILKTRDGSRKLAFYNERDNDHPYSSIPITRNRNKDDLNNMQNLLSIYKQQQQGDDVKQQDMIGFDDI
ncbi:hypothetical protein [Photobacterium leiognathi]|uniref:hypothetical protein n=1 Tax=Photobacterium leiognathi TaxID=553611 RepID=UPI0029815F6A|nr:hypothetical protein [Photobacterium leiognathi]